MCDIRFGSTNYKIEFELWFDYVHTDKDGEPIPKHPRFIVENLGWGIQDFYFHCAMDGKRGIDVSAWIFREENTDGCDFFFVDLCDVLIIEEEVESQQQK